MKKVIISAIVGISIGYALRRCEEKRFFQRMCHNINLFGKKIRKNIENRANEEQEGEFIVVAHVEERQIKEELEDDVLNEISY